MGKTALARAGRILPRKTNEATRERGARSFDRGTMISITVPLAFACSRSEVTWREVCIAIDRGWLRPADAIDFAARRLETSASPTPLECELAARRPDEAVLDLVRRLAAADAPQDENEISRKWMRLCLLWTYHRRAALEDPLAVVEEVWCAFDHPPELDAFIRYMPASDPAAVKRRSVEDNLAALRRSWERYMEDLDRELSTHREEKP